VAKDYAAIHPPGAGFGAPLEPAKQAYINEREKIAAENSAAAKTKFEGSVQSVQRLNDLQRSLDSLRGRPLQTGALAPLKQQVLKFLKDTVGVSDETAKDIASTEDAEKVSKLLSYSLGKSYYGAGREAYGTVANLMQSVPNIENTSAGNRMIIAGLRAQAAYDNDYYLAHEKWVQATDGNDNGFDAWFKAHNSLQKYSASAMAEAGDNKVGINDYQHIRSILSNPNLSDADRASEIDKFNRAHGVYNGKGDKNKLSSYTAIPVYEALKDYYGG